MKKLISFLLVFLAISLVAQAQEKNSSITALDLEIPNAPAFILLDAAPATIQRPNSSRALGVSLLQDFSSDGILDDIAIEVTPFWMLKSEKRSALGYYGIDKDLKQYPFSKLKLTSTSMAYVKSSDSIINIALGARATVFEWKRESDIKDYYDAYLGIEQLATNNLDYMDEFEAMHPEPECDNDGTNPLCVKEWEVYNKKLVEYIQKRICETAEEYGYTQKMQEIINRKPAIAVDVALAYNQRFMSDQFDSNGFGRFGVWSTVAASFFLDQQSYNYFNLYGFVRYLRSDSEYQFYDSDTFNSFDLGIKAELEFNKLIMGYEYINRSGDLEGYRSAGNIRYQVIENIFILGSFGNNFGTQDDVVTLLGVQWGLNGAAQILGIGN